MEVREEREGMKKVRKTRNGTIEHNIIRQCTNKANTNTNTEKGPRKDCPPISVYFPPLFTSMHPRFLDHALYHDKVIRDCGEERQNVYQQTGRDRPNYLHPVHTPSPFIRYYQRQTNNISINRAKQCKSHRQHLLLFALQTQSSSSSSSPPPRETETTRHTSSKVRSICGEGTRVRTPRETVTSLMDAVRTFVLYPGLFFLFSLCPRFSPNGVCPSQEKKVRGNEHELMRVMVVRGGELRERRYVIGQPVATKKIYLFHQRNVTTSVFF